MKAAEIQEIPVEGRDITRVLFDYQMYAGRTPEANVSINGASSLYTSYLIDGLNNNEAFSGRAKFAFRPDLLKDITRC
jgi:hypothetical protein